MRLLPLFVATASLLAGPAAAAPTGPPPDIEQITDVAGDYALADGRVARLFLHSRTLYIELDGQQQALLAVAPDRYMTGDGALSLRYRSGRWKDEIVIGHAVPPAGTPPQRPTALLPRQRCW